MKYFEQFLAQENLQSPNHTSLKNPKNSPSDNCLGSLGSCTAGTGDIGASEAVEYAHSGETADASTLLEAEVKSSEQKSNLAKVSTSNAEPLPTGECDPGALWDQGDSHCQDRQLHRLQTQMEGYLPLVEAAQHGRLPPGPLVFSPGLTITDPQLCVLSSWRELTHFIKIAETAKLHPTTGAMLQHRCEIMDAVKNWVYLVAWDQEV